MLTICYGYHSRITEEAINSLSNARREKALRITSDKRRLQSISASLLLEEELRHQGVMGEFAYTSSERGKPSLANSALEFSVSHSKKVGAALVATHVVGVDVEELGRGKEAVVRRFFTEEELHILQRLQGEAWDEAFTLLWTAKEGIAKCLDLPLAHIAKEIDLSKVIERVEKETCAVTVEGYGELYLRSFLEDGHIITGVSVVEDEFSLKHIDK